ncbi:MAG TPA: CBS domain-containing protein [Gemmatimonadaceae bacterium]|nr:CBS domain-containing protein [Gemmatimonadaceae bacterium]
MLRIRDIMTADVMSVTPETTMREAMEVFTARHVSGAPVLANGEVVGVVTSSDILAFAANEPTAAEVEEEQGDWAEEGEGEELDEGDEEEEPGAFFTEVWDDSDSDGEARFENARAKKHNALDEHTVSEVMTRAVRALPPTADILQAAEMMRKSAIHRVLVIEGKRLVGIVTTSDITRAVAEHRIGPRRYVFNDERDFDERGFK